MSHLPDTLLFGAAYYAEYQPHGAAPDRMERDLDLMVEAGVTVIRVGESVWSTWEPEDGRFELEWLGPVLDAAHARGIKVVLGTPTYAIPPWLVRRYPEMTGERATGQRIGWGARQEVDLTHPAFRFHAERVCRAILARWTDHPSVIGVQVDNEPGAEILFNEGIFQRFADELRHEYGTVEALNDAWGLVYWSHRLSTWADLWRPDGNVQPQYDVAWRAFQGRLVDEMIAWQADLAREYTSPDQFVTTCLDQARPGLDDDLVTESLSVNSGNSYYGMQDDLARPDHRDPDQSWTRHGAWSLFQSGDRLYSSKREPFLVTETTAGHIGFPWDTRPAFDGQWRQAAWALVSRGARMIEYWHWNTNTFGAETYWGGVLPHTGEPGRTYRELAGIGAELKAASGVFEGYRPEADVTILWDVPSKWLFSKYAVLCRPDGSPDPHSYSRLVDPFYRGTVDAGGQSTIVHARRLLAQDPAQAAAEHPLLVVSGYYLSDDAAPAWFDAYAAAGGHLVLGPRSLYADQLSRARVARGPAGLTAAAGVSYDEYSNLVAPLAVAPVEGGIALTEGGAAAKWVDGLELEEGSDAQVLLGYDHPHFGRWPALTRRAHGAGTVTTVGTLPDPVLGADVMRDLLGLVGGPVSGWRDLPPSVTVHTGRNAAGERVHVVHQFSWEPTEVTAPAALVDVLGEGTTGAVAAGETLLLGPWDVRVLVERR
ncbi:beta-galactosidase [Nocardioides sp. GY 10127]|uniref:beta-galactosidase n=1 Tax=Nocardioides sp. GY 10127 TaxID=2569762 RepID=UPI0010A7ADC4|nr:beta-galactosidase [Nocardioides sp. GY 10127]TIC79333.1 beta-galactosidase [Nocardioides sp. GY 10127]